MGRAHRWNTPQTATKRAREQDYRDRRRRAELERAMFAEAAAMMRPVDDAGAGLVVELVMRAAADGDENALRILAAREHLNALGVEHPEELDDRTWEAVRVTHTGGTPRALTTGGSRTTTA
ncbi:hypothetical protein DEJ34_03930 [Curtobacterium sp. MCPF17_050]|uniref:hypothetical protein n=1 Tax=Curtobacterium sp. MCPF17_050 TaxID=2175664 RepID=UPI000D87FC66|nr:hypothetical protein [Curtobacterium sp. MCPF17_050]WIB16293.1 hypothetical protein DEJ34_03930 [Curtobacterium sp. MCPF17_050]